MSVHAPGGAGGTAPTSQPAPTQIPNVGLIRAVSDEFVPEEERR